MTRNLTKAGSFGSTLSVVNPGYTTSSAKTVYRVIWGKLLVGIKHKMFGSTAHPKPPTTRLHPDGHLNHKILQQDPLSPISVPL